MDGGSAEHCVNIIPAVVYKQELKEVSEIASRDTGSTLPVAGCKACRPCSQRRIPHLLVLQEV